MIITVSTLHGVTEKSCDINDFTHFKRSSLSVAKIAFVNIVIIFKVKIHQSMFLHDDALDSIRIYLLFLFDRKIVYKEKMQ